MPNKFQIFPDGRAAGSAPVSASDFTTKEYVGLNYATASLAVLSEAVRNVTLLTSASYSAITPDPETLYVLTDVPTVKKPDVIYETDGTTGLLGHNQNSFTGSWQLEGLDLTPYRRIECFFKAAATSSGDTFTPAVVITVPLDEAAKGPTAYWGSTMTPLPFNRNRQYLVSVAVDITKTKFQVVHQNTIWDITTSDANNTGRYMYKILGYFD